MVLFGQVYQKKTTNEEQHFIQNPALCLVVNWMTFELHSYDIFPEDRPSSWLKTLVSKIGLWDPFQMAFSWLINGGY